LVSVGLFKVTSGAHEYNADARKAEADADREAALTAQERLKTAKTQIEVFQQQMDAMIHEIKDSQTKKLTRERLKIEISGLIGTKPELFTVVGHFEQLECIGECPRGESEQPSWGGLNESTNS
jgi:hypothetical protein